MPPLLVCWHQWRPPPADNNADAANADAVALALEAPPDNNADALADASDVALEFDWHSVSIIEII